MLLWGEAIQTEAFRVLEASQSAAQPFKLHVVLLLQWLRPGYFLLEAFEMLITLPSPLSSSLLQIRPPTTSDSWKRKCGSSRMIISFSHRWAAHAAEGKRACIWTVAQNNFLNSCPHGNAFTAHLKVSDRQLWWDKVVAWCLREAAPSRLSAC